MPYLTEEHAELSETQQSDFMQNFGSSRFDRKAITIFATLVTGLICGANAWTGESSDRVSFCLQSPTQQLQCLDANNRPYRMSRWHWDKWQREGKPSYVKFQASIKASNPYKPFWAGGAFLSFAFSGWMLRHLRDTEEKLSYYEDIRIRTNRTRSETEAQISLMPEYRNLQVAQVELQSDLELIAGDRTVLIQQAEILAETELEIAKLEAQDSLFAAQTAGMTPEQVQEYVDFIRAQKTPYLQGSQTLDGTTTPKDKVEGDEQQAIAQALTGQFAPVEPEAKPPADNVIAEIIKRVATEDGSTALCGDPGTGKSTITREYIRQVISNCPDADIAVLAVKNDSFCGLRDRGRVTRFIGESAIESATSFFLEIDREYKRRLDLPEEQREQLKPFVRILDDWLTISAGLNKFKPADLGFDFGQILFDLLIIGREYNMKFFVNLHSLNLAAIGIKNLDQNTRKVLRLLLLGNRYQKDGRSLDAYGVIEQAIMGNQVITHAQDKEIVREQYKTLKEQSRQLFQPIMFAFLGGYYLGIVPRFSEQKSIAMPPADIESPDAVPELRSELDGILASWAAKSEVSAIASQIIEIIKSGNEPVNVESIRKSRKWGDNAPGIEEIREALSELTIKEFVDGDKDKGYSLVK